MSSNCHVPSVGQAPRRRKVCAETAPVRAAAAAIEQMHFMLDAIERKQVTQGSQGRDEARHESCCVPRLYKLHSYLDLHTTLKAPIQIGQPQSIDLPGSTVIPVACSLCGKLGRGPMLGRLRGITPRCYCLRRTPQIPGPSYSCTFSVVEGGWQTCGLGMVAERDRKSRYDRQS
jgi:hypothetical protein